MKPSASAEILRELLVFAFEKRLGLAGGDRNQRRQARGAGERRDPPEDIGAQFLEFAGEAHDVHQRRTQIVADDIGEALDLVVGFAQVGGAFVDGGFEIEVVVAQLRFGVVAGARRAPHQKDRNRRPARPRDPNRRRSSIAASGWLRSASAVRCDEQMIFFGAHLVGEIVDALHGVAAVGFAHDAGGIVKTVACGQFDGSCEFLEPRLTGGT